VSPEVDYNVSDWLKADSDVISSGVKPRNISLLYASDRKLFNVTSESGIIRINVQDLLTIASGTYSLAVLAEYQPNVSALFLVCLRMAAPRDTSSMSSPLSFDHREITVQVRLIT